MSRPKLLRRNMRLRCDLRSLKSDSSYVVIDAFDKGSYIKIIHAKNEIIGYSTQEQRRCAR